MAKKNTKTTYTLHERGAMKPVVCKFTDEKGIETTYRAVMVQEIPNDNSSWARATWVEDAESITYAFSKNA